MLTPVLYFTIGFTIVISVSIYYYLYAIYLFKEDYKNHILNNTHLEYDDLSEVFYRKWNISDAGDVIITVLLLLVAFALFWPLTLSVLIIYFTGYFTIYKLILKINSSIRPSIDKKYPETKL